MSVKSEPESTGAKLADLVHAIALDALAVLLGAALALGAFGASGKACVAGEASAYSQSSRR